MSSLGPVHPPCCSGVAVVSCSKRGLCRGSLPSLGQAEVLNRNTNYFGADFPRYLGG